MRQVLEQPDVTELLFRLSLNGLLKPSCARIQSTWIRIRVCRDANASIGKEIGMEGRMDRELKQTQVEVEWEKGPESETKPELSSYSFVVRAIVLT